MESNMFAARGKYTFKQVRDGVVIDAWDQANLLPTQGLNYILNSSFVGTTPSTAWYIGIFQGNYTPLSTDTMATFPSSASESSSYTQSARQVCNFSSSTSADINNSASQASFTMNATVTIYGAFLASSASKNATTGVLASAAQFSGGARTLNSGDVLLVGYDLSLTSS